MASVITWFSSSTIKGGDFIVNQLWYKFSTSNGAGIFLRSEKLVHGTLRFEENNIAIHNFKLGLALVN
jgi:hypothetical protein